MKRLVEERPFGERPFKERPFEARHFKARPFEARPFEARPFKARPFEARLFKARLVEPRLVDLTRQHSKVYGSHTAVDGSMYIPIGVVSRSGRETEMEQRWSQELSTSSQ